LKLNFIQITGERSEESAQHFDSAYLQSLVIQKELRGKGLGKLMMRHAEEFLAKNFQNFKILYLNTKDQQRFYESIGYVRIEPFLFHVIESQKSACSKMISNLLGSLNTGSRLAAANNSTNNEQFGNTWYKKCF
jgi:ribosomal protein S18 acetylase RimI-like enzyme